MKINLSERQWDILLEALQHRMNDLEDIEVKLIDEREPEEEEPSGERAGREAYIATLSKPSVAEREAAYQQGVRQASEDYDERGFEHMEAVALKMRRDTDTPYADGYCRRAAELLRNPPAKPAPAQTPSEWVLHSDTEISLCEDGPTIEQQITLWRVRGVPQRFYPTKQAAETAARAHFPGDCATVRYSRITFINFNLTETE